MIFLTFILSLRLILGLYNSKSKVLQVNSKTFEESILRSRKSAFVEFYHEGCGHCRNLVPTWEKLAENMSKHVTIAAVDCKVSQDLCQRYQVKGYPSLKYFSLSQSNDARVILDYDSSRELSPLVEYAKRHANSFVYLIKKNISKSDKLTNKRIVTVDEFITKGNGLPKALLFKTGPSETVGLPLKSLSVNFFGKIVIGQVYLPNNQDVAKAYSVPIDKTSLLIVPPNSSLKSITHDGDLTFSGMYQFFQKYAEIKDWDKTEL